MSGTDSCSPSSAIVKLSLNNKALAPDVSQDEAGNPKLIEAASADGCPLDVTTHQETHMGSKTKSAKKQQHIAPLFKKQTDSLSADSKIRSNRPSLYVAIPPTTTEESLPTPKRQRSISADYEELMANLPNGSNDSAASEIPISKLRSDADRHMPEGELKLFLSGLLTQLQLDRSKTNLVIEDLLINKTAVVEAQTQADHAVSIATHVEQRVTSINMEQHKLDDKVERLKRMNDVVVRGILLIGNERFLELNEIVKKIAKFISCPISSRDIEQLRILSNRSSTDRTQRLLLIRFSTAAVRREFFMKYLTVDGGLRGSCIGRQTNERIFISDNLTSRNSVIRRQAAGMVRDGRLESYSVRDGLVYVKCHGNPSRLPILSSDQLDSLSTPMQVDNRNASTNINGNSASNPKIRLDRKGNDRKN